MGAVLEEVAPGVGLLVEEEVPPDDLAASLLEGVHELVGSRTVPDDYDVHGEYFVSTGIFPARMSLMMEVAWQAT